MDFMEGNVEVVIESGGVHLESGSSASDASECDAILSKGCGWLSKIEGLRGEGCDESGGCNIKSGEFNREGAHVVLDMHSGMECSNHMNFEEKGHPKEKRLKPYSNKHSKPPRPPKGPLLNSSDLLLVREISELAVKKRLKIEKQRALKKMKASRGSSCGGGIIALAVTIVFFIIVIFQGVCSGGGIQTGFQGSPEPSAANKGLISVQFYSKPPSTEMNGSIDRYSKSLEPASGSLPQVEEGRDAQ